LPLDLRANWLFRVTPTPGGAVRLSPVRGALLAISVFPVWAASAALLFWFCPWMIAAEHLLLLGLLGLVLVDASLKGFGKIPFTCSYLPGKSKVHMVFWFGIIPLVVAIQQAAELEQRAMSSPLGYSAMVVTLGAVAFAARRLTNMSANRSGPEVQFEESASDELVGLGLNG
jgi:hypothetical protein